MFYIYKAEEDYVPGLLGVIENLRICTPTRSRHTATVYCQEKGKGKGKKKTP